MTTIDTSLPLRLTVRVVIRKGDKVCLCYNKKNGAIVYYNVPGGGVEDGDSMEVTAVKECLEEVGIRVRGVKPLGVHLPKHHLMNKPERNAIWSGTDTHYFVADYVRDDHSVLGADGDQQTYMWVDVQEAIELIKGGPVSEFNDVKIQALRAVLPKDIAGKKPAFLSW